MKIFQGFSV